MNAEVKDFIDEGLKKFPQAQKVAETRDYIFIHIPDSEASVFFSQNEKAYLESQGREWEVWCTAKPDTAKFSFPYYARDNMFIFVQNKKDINNTEVLLVNLTRDTDRFQYVTYDNKHYPLTKTARPQYYKVAETLWNKYERIPKQGELPFVVEEPKKDGIKESKQKTMRTLKMDPDQLIALGLARYPDGAILVDDTGDYYAIELKNALASSWFGQIQRAWTYKNEAYPWDISIPNSSTSMFDMLTRHFKFVYFQNKTEPLDIYMAMINTGGEGKMPEGVAVYDKENRLVGEPNIPEEIRNVCNKFIAEAYINFTMNEYKEKPQVKEAKMIKRDRKRELNEATAFFPIFAAIAEGLAVAGSVVFMALLIYLWKKISKNTDITTTADFQNLSKQEQDEIKKSVANNLDEGDIEIFMKRKPLYFKPQASSDTYFKKFVAAFKRYLSIAGQEIAKEGPPFNKGINPYHNWNKTDESKSNEPYSEGYNFDEYKNKNGKYLWEETRGSKKRPPLKKPRSFGKFLKPEEPVEYTDYYCEKCGMPISEEDAFVYGGLCMACGEDMSSTRIRNIAEMPNIYEQKQLNEGEVIDFKKFKTTEEAINDKIGKVAQKIIDSSEYERNTKNKEGEWMMLHFGLPLIRRVYNYKQFIRILNNTSITPDWDIVTSKLTFDEYLNAGWEFVLVLLSDRLNTPYLIARDNEGKLYFYGEDDRGITKEKFIQLTKIDPEHVKKHQFSAVENNIKSFKESQQLNEWVGPDPGLAMYAVMIPMAIYGLYDVTREAGKYISYKEFSSFPREKKLDILKDALQVLETEYNPETYADFIDYAVDKVKPRFPAFYSLFMKAISKIGGKRNAYEITIDNIKDKIHNLETYATSPVVEETLNNSGNKKIIKEAIMTPDVNEEIISVVFDAVLKALFEEMSKNDPHMSESVILERVYDEVLEMSDEELMGVMKAIGIWEQNKRIFVEDGIAFELLREKFLEGMESL